MKSLVPAITLVLALSINSVVAGPALGAATIQVPSQYATIQAAMNVAVSGDTVLVAPGTYSGAVNFNNKLIALRSTGGAQQTTISVTGGIAVQVAGAAEISGFTITGAFSDFGAGVRVSGVGTLIKNNVFDGNRQSAGGFGAAIGGNGASPIIDGNLFRNQTADSQHLSGVVCFVNGSSPTIMNNIFVDNPTRAINLVLPAGNQPKVLNNTFVRNQTAIKYGSFPPDTVFRNNILASNTIGFSLDYPGDVPVFDHNLVWGNGTNYLGMADPTGTDGNLSANPLFVNSLNDFRLAAGSPGMDVGSLLAAPDHDYLGNARPAGPGVDLGAFEAVPEPSAGLALVSMMAALTLRRRVA
jgi:serine protease